MKKIVLIMLVTMVPFLTMAQKKAKKNVKTEKIVESSSTYNFMVITGYEMTIKAEDTGDIKASKPVELKSREMMKTKMMINFDFGGIKSPENINLMKDARRYMTMAAAVNAAAEGGWEFVSANVLSASGNITHYYYMKRKK